ncbi:MFS transporter [Actinomadura verrucosospora]|uniref:EmrB/QacA family drug resistance transporter n=1 Tax=Actinomadura verrucosospora TaxID=46165 RepID=A0A7D3VST4_ACTVE|nr:MFS transporter [Actinomadura verrucosospora]QKG22000.1 EmrB/QacA family drug resistance transporter [Actinomadura verrucosospora]
MGKWWPLTAVCVGAFMLLVDVNIVTVALPDMAAGLGASYSSLQWVMDVYALVLAALLMGAGALADRAGRRRVYVIGLVLFALASLACGIAPDAAVLLAARAVQGAGAAMMFATTVALVTSSYEGRDRAVAFGVWGAANGAAAGVGPVLGGLVTQGLGWRWIFLLNLPVSVLAVALTLRVVAESRDPAARRIDVPGVVLFAAAAGAVTYGLTRAGDAGWTSAPTLGWLTAGAAALAAFAVAELRSPHPILDLRLFRAPAFTGVMIASLAMSGTAFGYLLYTSLWLQSAAGLSAIGAGLAILPMSGLAFAASWLTGRFLHAVPPRLTVGAGLLLVGAGTLGQSVLTAGSGWAALAPGFAVTGVGVGIALPNVTAAATAAVPPERVGSAAGAVSALRQLGFAFGIAVLGSVFHAALERSLDGDVPDAAGTARAVAGGHAAQAVHGASGGAVESAFASALDAATATAGVIAIAAAIAVFALVRRDRPQAGAAAAEPAAATAR